ncbi:LysR family transcriptional regulator [Nitratireductor sp. CAU 1489]|uniref:LysR family transcriptional regulator n=1 Tax=Nitratireductor arenosus TaxID=2682096 RepID=A0A844QJJ8_9HYPH|nr:LysR substrate-binding domain-containing protein [Nitratireductor arenosus]MVA97869.1 LysR family transcriptional regulator [Nitratireductor arenosus]
MSKTDGQNGQLDSTLLRVFLAVARAGSLSAGAAQLLRTQSAVSLQVQKLERAVGARVFERHGRGVVMTPAGETLLPVARHVVDVLDQAATRLRGEPVGEEIRLGVPEEYSDTILPAILAAFTEGQSTARLFVRCTSSMDFPRALAQGELDLALHSPPQVAKSDRIVHSERAVWAGPAFQDLEARRPLPVALFDRTCWWRERCLDLLSQSELDYRIVLTSESVAGVRAAIAAGIAVGVLPQSTLSGQPGLRMIADEVLPHLGETHLALSASPGGSGPLAARLATIIADVFAATAT